MSAKWRSLGEISLSNWSHFDPMENSKEEKTRDVAAWMRQIRNKASVHGVSNAHEDYGDRIGVIFRGLQGRRSHDQDYFRLQAHQVRGGGS